MIQPIEQVTIGVMILCRIGQPDAVGEVLTRDSHFMTDEPTATCH